VRPSSTSVRTPGKPRRDHRRAAGERLEQHQAEGLGAVDRRQRQRVGGAVVVGEGLVVDVADEATRSPSRARAWASYSVRHSPSPPTTSAASGICAIASIRTCKPLKIVGAVEPGRGRTPSADRGGPAGAEAGAVAARREGGQVDAAGDGDELGLQRRQGGARNEDAA
jgi:hypothetical protein